MTTEQVKLEPCLRWNRSTETPSTIITPHGRISINWSESKAGHAVDYSLAEDTAAMIVDAVNAHIDPPSPDAGERREAVARIIDPNNWSWHDEYVQKAERSSMAGQADSYLRRAGDFVRQSLIKADAILALSPAPDADTVMVPKAIVEALDALEVLLSAEPDMPTYQSDYDAASDALDRAREALAASQVKPDPLPAREPFQVRVQPWMMECFGEMIAGDRMERNHRFLEEALELVQACGCTASEARQLVDYVYGRDTGESAQEVGGVMVTLAALCLANDLDMYACGETELARVWTKVEAIRAKQAAKPKHSPLPQALPSQDGVE